MQKPLTEDSIYLAVMRGDIAALEAIVAIDAMLEEMLEYRDEENGGNTPLIEACFRGQEAMVSILLEAGADVSIRDNDEGHSPLCGAADFGSASLCNLLLNTADSEGLNIIDGHPSCLNETPLGIACSLAQVQVVSLLLSRGADVNGARLSPSPLCIACQAAGEATGEVWRSSLFEIVKLLLEAGADTGQRMASINEELVRSYDGWTPLHIAAKLGLAEILKLLLTHGADEDLRTKSEKKSAYQLAKDETCRELLSLKGKKTTKTPKPKKFHHEKAKGSEVRKSTQTNECSCLEAEAESFLRPVLKAHQQRGAARNPGKKVTWAI